MSTPERPLRRNSENRAAAGLAPGGEINRSCGRRLFPDRGGESEVAREPFGLHTVRGQAQADGRPIVVPRPAALEDSTSLAQQDEGGGGSVSRLRRQSVAGPLTRSVKP